MLKILINKNSNEPTLGIRGLISLTLGALVLMMFGYEFTSVSDIVIPVVGVLLLGFGITSLAEAFDHNK